MKFKNKSKYFLQGFLRNLRFLLIWLWVFHAAQGHVIPLGKAENLENSEKILEELRIPQKYIIEPVQVITKEGENSEIPPYDEVDFNNEILSEKEKNELQHPKSLTNSKQPLENKEQNVDISEEKSKSEKSAQKETISSKKVEKESTLDVSPLDLKKENENSSTDSKKSQKMATQNMDISSEGIKSENVPQKETHIPEKVGTGSSLDSSLPDSKIVVLESTESSDTSNTNQDAESAGLLKTLGKFLHTALLN